MYKKVLTIILLLATFVLLSGCQIYDYSERGLQITKEFYHHLDNENYSQAKELVSIFLKPKIEDMKNVFRAYEADVKYNGLEYKVVASNNEGVVIRAYYTLILQTKFNNKSQDVIMEISLRPVENEGLKIVALQQIK